MPNLFGYATNPRITPFPLTSTSDSSRHLLGLNLFHRPHRSFALRHQPHRCIDHRASSQFRAAPQRRIAQFGIELLHRQPANNLVSQQP